MKTFKIYFSVVLFIAVLLGCNKDVDIADEFNFSLEVTNENDVYKDDLTDVDININPVRIIDGVNYTFKFRFANATGDLISDEGYFEGINGTVINEDEEYVLTELNETLQFKPQEIGTANIEIEVTDSNGFVQIENIIFNVIHAPFTFTVTPENSILPINYDSNLIINLVRSSETTEDGSLDFDIEYHNIDGTGKVFINNNEIDEFTQFQLPEGQSTIQYKPTSIGEHKVSFKAIAPDGAERIEEIVFTVEHLDFTIDAFTSTSSIEANQDLTVTVNFIENNVDDTVTYQIKHYFESGAGGLYDNDALIAPNNLQPITNGVYQYVFRSSELGENKIVFHVEDSNGNVKTDFIILNVTNIPFTFNGTPTDLIVPINTATNFNFTINPNGDATGLQYSVSFQQLEGTGTIIDHNGNDLIAGADVNVPDTTPFVFSYTPTSTGNHQLKFIATDAYGESMEVIISIVAEHNELIFIVTPSATNIFLNQTIDLAFTITEVIPTSGITYELNYYSTGGTGVLSNNGNTIYPGTFNSVSLGSFTYQYTPTNTGTQSLIFQLKDSNGQIIEAQPVNLNVNNSDFTFAATGDPLTLYVGETGNINLNLSQDFDDSSITYEAMYVYNSGSATINDQSNSVLGAGIYVPINTGSTTWSFIPTTPGAVQLEITARDSNGSIHQATVTFNVEERDFTFDADAIDNSALVNRSADINLSITPIPFVNDNYEISYTSTGNGQILYNGGVITQGQTFNLLNGVTGIEYVGFEEGNHTISFFARNSADVIHNDSVSVEFSKPSFNVNVTAGVENALLNEEVTMTVTIDELDNPAYGDTYSLTYTSSLNGHIIYNGTTYSPGETITGLNSSSYFFTYIGEVVGNHNVEFTVQNSFNDTETASDDVQISIPDFDLTVSESPNSFYLGDTGNINVAITDNNDPNNNYQFRYVFNSNDGQVLLVQSGGNTILPQNSWIPAPSNNFSLLYNAQYTGSASLTIEVRNVLDPSNTETDNASFNVLESTFDFDVSAAIGSFNVYEQGALIMNLVPQGSSNITYEMTYTAQVPVRLLINGVWYDNGDNIPIQPGTTSAGIVFNNTGTQNVNFIVTASNNVIRQDDIDLEILKLPVTDVVHYNRVLTNQNDCGGGDCDYDHHHYISFNLNTNDINASNPNRWVTYHITFPQSGHGYSGNLTDNLSTYGGRISHKFRFDADRELDDVPTYFPGTQISFYLIDANGNESQTFDGVTSAY